MHATLIVPAPYTAMVGGDAYDRRIVDGLRSIGHAVDVRVMAPQDAAALLPSLSDETILVIDGLALPAFAECGAMLATRRAVALIHHPTALDTASSETDRAARRDLERRLLACCTRVIAASEATADILASAFDVARERIVVVTPGTDDAPRSADSGGPGCHVLSVGALVPRKGHDLLLRALARLFDLQWRLTIVGSTTRDPVCARGLVALADELGIAGRVDFAGELDAAGLDALWQRADVFALATHWEGYGTAVAEALKRGVPPVVTQSSATAGGAAAVGTTASGAAAVGAAAELVTLESGVVCPVGDQEQLSRSLRRIIFGAALRRDMAEAAWRVGQTLPDWPTQARVFAEALADPHPKPLPQAGEGADRAAG